MDEKKRERLIELGAEALADALLELACQDDAANDLVERMTATSKENIKRFKAKLSGLKRRKRFISWRESASFARGLTSLLEDLKAGVDEPLVGAELVAAFYEADRGAIDQCDDSSGHVGDVFRFDARELFVWYAARCEDKEWLADLVLKVNLEDDYGLRDKLIDCASEYLPDDVMRGMVEVLWEKAEKQTDEYKKGHWLRLVESLAKQLKDAPLFEKARIASWGEIPTAACIDIAEVYSESGDAQTALSWLERIGEGESFRADARDKLLLKVHRSLGKVEEEAATAWRLFRRSRSEKSLADLLSVIGEGERESVLADESGRILQDEELSYVDAAFLIDVRRFDEAEDYLLARADQLNGDYYGGLLPLAEAMETAGRMLPASVIYRALLDSILRRAQSKSYNHGVRYLKKLDKLAGKVTNWRGIQQHSAYSEDLRQAHRRKSSFWSRYGK